MASGARRTARGAVPDEGGAGVEAWASRRLVWGDNLKVLMIAGIIAIHAVLGYAGTVEAWTYSEVRETTLSPVAEGVLFVLVAPFGFFLIALLFLVAGLFTPGSLERKGPRAYAADRLLRLGVPFLVYVLVVQPSLTYPLQHAWSDADGSYWEEYLGEERRLDTGPLWFVGVLLVFSLAYAGWVRVRRGRAARSAPEITVGRLLLVAAVVAPVSFLVRLVYPYGSEAGFTDLNFWEWPACIAVFGLGVVTARQGWLDTVPDRLRRQCRLGALLALGAMAVLVATTGFLDVVDDAGGGANPWAVAFAVVESPLVVLGPVWMLAEAQRHLDRPHRWGPALSRSAYAAFMVQTPVLLGLAVALRPVPLPADLKALVVVCGGVAVSFGLAWLLIEKVRGVARVL